MHMLRVEAKDGRRFEFPDTLTGMARLVGPEGGTYGFDAALLRAFLQSWTRNSVDATCRAKYQMAAASNFRKYSRAQPD